MSGAGQPQRRVSAIKEMPRLVTGYDDDCGGYRIARYRCPLEFGQKRVRSRSLFFESIPPILDASIGAVTLDDPCVGDVVVGRAPHVRPVGVDSSRTASAPLLARPQRVQGEKEITVGGWGGPVVECVPSDRVGVGVSLRGDRCEPVGIRAETKSRSGGSRSDSDLFGPRWSQLVGFEKWLPPTPTIERDSATT